MRALRGAVPGIVAVIVVDVVGGGFLLPGIDFCREIGCNLALDDFGSGLSSFAYLKRFRVQALKIDGMFVRNVDFDLDDRAVVESIVRLSQLRKLHTVAEFVTSEDVLAVVKDLDVDYGQGYALHIPEPLENPGPVR